MADTVLRKISEDERLQAIREDRETAEIFLRMEKAYAREKGMAEGREIGLQEGRTEGLAEGRAEGLRQGLLEIAAKMKALGDSVEHIVAVTGLTKEEIEDL